MKDGQPGAGRGRVRGLLPSDRPAPSLCARGRSPVGSGDTTCAGCDTAHEACLRGSRSGTAPHHGGAAVFRSRLGLLAELGAHIVDESGFGELLGRETPRVHSGRLDHQRRKCSKVRYRRQIRARAPAIRARTLTQRDWGSLTSPRRLDRVRPHPGYPREETSSDSRLRSIFHSTRSPRRSVFKFKNAPSFIFAFCLLPFDLLFLAPNHSRGDRTVRRLLSTVYCLLGSAGFVDGFRGSGPVIVQGCETELGDDLFGGQFRID